MDATHQMKDDEVFQYVGDGYKVKIVHLTALDRIAVSITKDGNPTLDLIMTTGQFTSMLMSRAPGPG